MADTAQGLTAKDAEDVAGVQMFWGLKACVDSLEGISQRLHGGNQGVVCSGVSWSSICGWEQENECRISS